MGQGTEQASQRRTLEFDLDRRDGDTDALVAPEFGHEDGGHAARLGQAVALKDGGECRREELLRRLAEGRAALQAIQNAPRTAEGVSQAERRIGQSRRGRERTFMQMRSRPPVTSLILEKTTASAGPASAGTCFLSA